MPRKYADSAFSFEGEASVETFHDRHHLVPAQQQQLAVPFMGSHVLTDRNDQQHDPEGLHSSLETQEQMQLHALDPPPSSSSFLPSEGGQGKSEILEDSAMALPGAAHGQAALLPGEFTFSFWM